METQKVIERLEKEFGIEFSNSRDLSYWNNENIGVRVVDNDVSKYAYCVIDGTVDTTYWITNLEQATDETLDEFISKIKSHLPKNEDNKEEYTYGNETVDDILEEIQEHQKSINVLLNRLNYKLKKGEIK